MDSPFKIHLMGDDKVPLLVNDDLTPISIPDFLEKAADNVDILFFRDGNHFHSPHDAIAEQVPLLKAPIQIRSA